MYVTAVGLADSCHSNVPLWECDISVSGSGNSISEPKSVSTSRSQLKL